MASKVNGGSTGGLRAARVNDTEERLLAAAHELFVRQGYAGTTLADVADAAGVAHRTVYVRFGTKAALMNRVIDVALVGDTLPVAVADRDWAQRTMTAPSLAERIDAYAEAAAALMARAAPAIAVAVQAEHSEPEIATAAKAGRDATREAVRRFWQQAHDDGLLDPACALAWLVDTSSLLAHAETHVLGLRTLEWSQERYRQWLATTWTRLHSAASG